MTGNVSLDISIEGLWNSWRRFSAGKRRTCELDSFSYRIEQELFLLEQELKDETYHHGEYRTFVVSDCKKRTISVASIRDRVVHRLLYDYLVRCFDHTFIYDAWSCRRGKGLADAIDRAQKFARSFANGFVWRSDVRKFFDTVSHDVLLSLLTRRVGDPVALSLAHEIISSCRVPKASGGGDTFAGLPIGNVTSQVFGNIYLNEFDRFVSHVIRPARYMRYGDDVLLFAQTKTEAEEYRHRSICFLKDVLHLEINSHSDILLPVRAGIRYLGVEIFPSSRRLLPRGRIRIREKLSGVNRGSYYGLVHAYENETYQRMFDWSILCQLDL